MKICHASTPGLTNKIVPTTEAYITKLFICSSTPNETETETETSMANRIRTRSMTKKMSIQAKEDEPKGISISSSFFSKDELLTEILVRISKKSKKGEDDEGVSVVSSTFFLSDELVTEILLRVPMKTLFRFKCVCKVWNELISDPSFINIFISRSKSLPPLITGIFYKQFKPINKVDSKVNFYESESVSSVDTSLSFLRRPIAVVAASPNGLVLCAEKPFQGSILHYHRLNFIVCNPLTKQKILLPKTLREHCIRHVVLFCYDKNVGDYQQLEFKVVSFRCWLGEELQVESYSSETGAWRISNYINETFPLNKKVLFDGSVYFWKLRRLYVYDINAESISSIDLPPMCGRFGIDKGHLGVSNGMLCYAENSMGHFNVWVRFDGVEWSLTHSISFDNLMNEFPLSSDDRGILQPIAFHPLNHKLVFVTWGQKDLFLYDTEANWVVLIHGIYPNSFSPVVPYFLPAWSPCLRTPVRRLKRKQ